AAGRDRVGADQAENGGKAGVAADRGIAVSTMAADARHLECGLIEHDVVRLIRLRVRMISRHRNIDRIVERDGGVNEASVKISVSAIAGMVVSGRDGIGADQAMAGGIARAVACTSGGMAGAAVPIDRCISTDRRIAATAASAHPGDLHRTLMELSRARLITGGGPATAPRP